MFFFEVVLANIVSFCLIMGFLAFVGVSIKS